VDADRAAELFSAFGPVSVRRMFGGSGVYADGVMFALEARGTLYLKSGPETDPAFEREGCEAFAYDARAGRRVLTSYRRAPERTLEEPEEMAAWARKALAVARAKRPARTRR
jgi:DNA transformation protein